MILTLIGISIGFSAGMVFGAWWALRDQPRLWAHIDILEGDKRALTESLCRAQGKPYITPKSERITIPSEGWFDGATRVEVKN